MVAGYIEERDGLTFATVRGAGHAVPQFKPAESYKLVFNWIKDTLDQI
jgi:serine carboxypeptidase-like clade 2